MTSHNNVYQLGQYVPNILAFFGECPPADHALSPLDIPTVYLQQLLNSMISQLFQLRPVEDMLPLMAGGRHNNRNLPTRFRQAHNMFANELFNQIHEALGVSNAVIQLVMTYLNQDPVCVHCDKVVGHRCACCNNGVHFDGANKKLPCARQVEFVPVTATIETADDADLVEMMPLDKECVDCLARKVVCGVCNEPHKDSDPIIRCMYPGCTSTTHKNCPEFSNDFEEEEEKEIDWISLRVNDDGDVEDYACRLHDIASALDLRPCLKCHRYEFPSNEIVDPRLYGPCSKESGVFKNKFACCALCGEAFHVNCLQFYQTCVECHDTEKLCYHSGDPDVSLICEGCYNDTNTCVYCEDGMEAFPSKNEVKHCDTCDKTYHKKCSDTHTVQFCAGWKESYCNDCWSALPSNEQCDTLEGNADRRSIRRSKAFGRAFLAVHTLPWVYSVPIVAKHIATNVPTLSNLLPLLPDILLFHFYMPWNMFDLMARSNHATALKAGVPLPPQHCEEDVLSLMRKHLDDFTGIDMEPWKAGISCDAWRALVKLDGM